MWSRRLFYFKELPEQCSFLLSMLLFHFSFFEACAGGEKRTIIGLGLVLFGRELSSLYLLFTASVLLFVTPPPPTRRVISWAVYMRIGI